MAKKRPDGSKSPTRSVPITTTIDVPIFGASCEITVGEDMVAGAQEVLTQALGTRNFRPVPLQRVIIFSQRELFNTVQWGTTAARQARYDGLVEHFNQDVSPVKKQDSPGLQFGQLHVVKHPYADPRQGSTGADRLFLAAQLYPKERQQASPALRMRAIARSLMLAVTHGHNSPPPTADIKQPFVVLGEYPRASIDPETNKTLQADLHALGTLTVGPLVIVEGFDPQALTHAPA